MVGQVHEAARIPELVQRAVRTATSGRPGPVMVSLPLDVQLAEADAAVQPSFRMPFCSGPAAGRGGRRAGGRGRAPGDHRPAARDPRPGLRPRPDRPGRAPADPGRHHLAAEERVPERLAAVLRQPRLRGRRRHRPPGERGRRGARHRLPVLGVHHQADAGARHGGAHPRGHRPGVIGRYYVPAVGICADAPLATASLLAAASDRAAPPGPGAGQPGRLPHPGQAHFGPNGWRRRLGYPDRRARGHPRSRGAVLVQDAPSLGTWIHRYVDFTSPGTFYAAAGGSMGWGLPAAMGIRLARLAVPVVAVCGDGSFWMVAQDLETAVRERLPVVTVINNNFAFGNTRDRQAVAHGGRYLGVFYGNPDFAAFARLLGAHGERVERDEDLLPALVRALDSAERDGLPAVVDVIRTGTRACRPTSPPRPPGRRPSSVSTASVSTASGRKRQVRRLRTAGRLGILGMAVATAMTGCAGGSA